VDSRLCRRDCLSGQPWESTLLPSRASARAAEQPSSRATTARRSLRGERRPLSRRSDTSFEIRPSPPRRDDRDPGVGREARARCPLLRALGAELREGDRPPRARRRIPGGLISRKKLRPSLRVTGPAADHAGLCRNRWGSVQAGVPFSRRRRLTPRFVRLSAKPPYRF
jgi:hypothetical protein